MQTSQKMIVAVAILISLIGGYFSLSASREFPPFAAPSPTPPYLELIELGTVAKEQGQLEEALDYFLRAQTIAREERDLAKQAATLNYVGTAYRSQNLHEQALESYLEALIISRELGDREVQATTLNNIGTTYRAQSLYEQALESYMHALTLARETGNRQKEEFILGNIENLPDL